MVVCIPMPLCQVVRIRGSGFPLRESWETIHRFAVQNSLYQCAVPGSSTRTAPESLAAAGLQPSHFARAMLHKCLAPFSWHEGRTKVFLKQDAYVHMKQGHIRYCSIAIQRRWHGYFARRCIRIVRKAIAVMISKYRSWNLQRQFASALSGVSMFQRRVRRFVRRKLFLVRYRFQKYTYFIYRWKLIHRLRLRHAAKLVHLILTRKMWKHRVASFLFLMRQLRAAYL
jgi:myosin heavy subunit